MATPDRRRQMHQAPLHKVATPPAPLLLMSASQSLTFNSDDVRMSPAVLLPVCQPSVAAAPVDPIADGQPVDSLMGMAVEMVPASQYQSMSLSDGSSQWTEIQNNPYAVTSDNQSEFSEFLVQEPEVTSPGHDFYQQNAGLYMESAESHMPSLQQNEDKPSGQTPLLLSPSTAGSKGLANTLYSPVQFHWFYCRNVELRQIWQPFSKIDSDNLEAAHKSLGDDSSPSSMNTIVSVNGGRYDVDVAQRRRRAVYWEEPDSHVRRCSWFYRADGDTRVVPYEEDFATRLEESYHNVLISGSWHQKLEYPEGDMVIVHSPAVILHFTASASSPGQHWEGMMGESSQQRSLKRGIEDFDNIPEDEAKHVDFLVFVVHGIGPGCDLRFRNIVECVDDFRSVSHQMLASHFREQLDSNRIGRVEYLPVRWHSALHGDATGIDRKLKAITLNSIGRLRQFTNDTLLDVLFYGSPAYAQQIADTIGSEMNRLYELFCGRNPDFSGTVAVAGHSLGSLILFDLLVHQNAASVAETSSTYESDSRTVNENGAVSAQLTEKSQFDTKDQPANDNTSTNEDDTTVGGVLDIVGLAEYKTLFEREQIDMDTLMLCEANDLKEMGLPLGPRKKLLSYLEQKKHGKSSSAPLPPHSFAEPVSSPVDTGVNAVTRSPQRDNRCDPLLRSASNTSVNFVVGGAGTGVQLVSYPRLQFNPCTFFALGSPIAMFLTVRGVDALGEEFRLPTCPGFFNIFHPFDPVAYRIEPLIISSCPVKPVLMPHHKGRKRLHLELKESLSRVGSDLKQKIIDSVKSTWRTINSIAHYHRSDAPTVAADDTSNLSSANADDDISGIIQDTSSYYADATGSSGSVHGQNMLDEEYPVGRLNAGRRIDYVLQEKPIESVNDYLFALSSHACYWESEDTLLMILKELYSLIGVSSCKSSVDLIPTNQTIATFPRHPSATTLATSSDRTVQHWPTDQPSNSAQDAIDFAVTYDSSQFVVSSESYVPPPESNISSPGAGLPPNVGPPPRSGFIRK